MTTPLITLDQAQKIARDCGLRLGMPLPESLLGLTRGRPERQAPWREMIEDTKEVFSYDSPETTQTTRDVIEYVKSYLEVYVDKASGITAPRNIAKALEQPGKQPVVFVSPEQLAHIIDPPDGSGVYIPMRKTPAGKFTLALFSHPPAQPQADTVAVPRELPNDWTGHVAWAKLTPKSGHVVLKSSTVLAVNALLAGGKP